MFDILIIGWTINLIVLITGVVILFLTGMLNLLFLGVTKTYMDIHKSKQFDAEVQEKISKDFKKKLKIEAAFKLFLPFTGILTFIILIHDLIVSNFYIPVFSNIQSQRILNRFEQTK